MSVKLLVSDMQECHGTLLPEHCQLGAGLLPQGRRSLSRQL